MSGPVEIVLIIAAIGYVLARRGPGGLTALIDDVRDLGFRQPNEGTGPHHEPGHSVIEDNATR
ncbi:hypothetical protein ORV05_12745 [Amycolatopsis cynarae]|uniref:Twin-arginine translocase TatA/TatE family subunit n=1 Tax=Amycolatopsis cynarae TaxID=2995223 RepID=A0ABY7B8C2_9PSEU|nr:hypothetical protein [Amycolatopsis sp. HUAS 11-8]WAL68599.1 hypothetical protein ORV05_12745 [Amycolatopsis sp. HUAS 11-8]